MFILKHFKSINISLVLLILWRKTQIQKNQLGTLL